MPLVLWKKPIYLTWSFNLGRRLQVYHTSGSCESVLRVHKLKNKIFVLYLALLQITGAPLKRAHIHIWIPKLCNCHTSKLLGLKANWVSDCSPKDRYRFAYLKSCCLKVKLPISLKLGPDWYPSFWNTHRSWHTLNNWDPPRENKSVQTITKARKTTKSCLNIRFISYTKPLL